MTKLTWIAFPFGGTIPRAITGGAERLVGPHEPVQVPADYGKQLTDDRFAYAASPPKAGKQPKSGGAPPKPSIEELQARLADLQQRLADTTDIDQQAILRPDIEAIECAIAAG